MFTLIEIPLNLAFSSAMELQGNSSWYSIGWWTWVSPDGPELTIMVCNCWTLSSQVQYSLDLLKCWRHILLLRKLARMLMVNLIKFLTWTKVACPLALASPKLVFKTGTKSACAIGSGDKSQITIVGCVSAAGFCFPPIVIWDMKTLSPELAVGEVPGTVYGLSTKGWIDQGLFQDWFCHHFLYYAPSARPLLLLLEV